MRHYRIASYVNHGHAGVDRRHECPNFQVLDDTEALPTGVVQDNVAVVARKNEGARDDTPDIPTGYCLE